MDEVTNQEGSVQEEIQAQTEVAAPETEIRQDSATTQQPQESSTFRQLRREREEFKKEAQMYKELMKQVVANQPQQFQPQAQPEEDILASISKEEYVPGEKVAKGFKSLEAKFNRQLQEIEQRYQGQAEKALLDDLRREHSDFNEIVNPETLELLKEIDPRRAAALEHTPDPYVRWATTYDIIKSRGLVEKIPNARQVKEVDKKIEQNKKVVQSPQVFDKRPMAKAFDYSRMDKKAQEELQREMNQYASMAGSVPNMG
jgi:hypothetical protein